MKFVIFALCAVSSTALWPITKECHWCNQGQWNYAATESDCLTIALQKGSDVYTYKPQQKNCRVQPNHKMCTWYGGPYGDCAGNVHQRPSGWSEAPDGSTTTTPAPTTTTTTTTTTTQAPITGLWPITKECHWCNQGQWHGNVATESDCQTIALQQ